MNGKRITAVLATAAAASMLLAGCGTGTGTAAGGDDMTAKIEAVTADQLDGTTITMSRMFGDCEETTKGVTDTAVAASECEAIQILTNKFNAENEHGISVERLGGAD